MRCAPAQAAGRKHCVNATTRWASSLKAPGFTQTTKTAAQIVQAAPAAAQQAPPNRHAPSPSSGQGAGQT